MLNCEKISSWLSSQNNSSKKSTSKTIPKGRKINNNITIQVSKQGRNNVKKLPRGIYGHTQLLNSQAGYVKPHPYIPCQTMCILSPLLYTFFMPSLWLVISTRHRTCNNNSLARYEYQPYSIPYAVDPGYVAKKKYHPKISFKCLANCISGSPSWICAAILQCIHYYRAWLQSQQQQLYGDSDDV